jgi:hypothetical protein
LGAALVASLTGILSGAFSAAASKIWSFVDPDDPVDAVTVSVDLAGNGSWTVPHPLKDLEYPAGDHRDADTWHEWAVSNGGGEDGSTLVEVIVQGRTSKAVVLTDLRVRVVKRRPPPKGTRVLLTAGAGLPTRYFNVNLDDRPPTWQYEHGEDDTVKPVKFPYRVSGAQPEVFLLGAYTRDCDCQWSAELFWVADGKPDSLVLDNNGEPFRTISSKRSEPYSYTVGNGQFEPLDQ